MAVAQSSARPSLESTEVEAREWHWRRVRTRVAIGYCLVLGLFVLLVGIPTDREGLLLWIVAGLSIRCLGRGWRAFGRILLDWLPFTGVLVLYDYTRGFADTLGMPIHVHGPADADLWMFHGVLPTAWMQQHLYVPGEVRWYDAVVTLVYTSHFLATPIVAAFLWIRDRQLWVRFIRRVIALAFVGLAGYTLYPAAPPWYAAREGVIEPVMRTTSRGWTELGLNHAGQVLSKGQAAVNLVAAMPSLHTAYATLVTLFFIRRVRWWARVLLGCYPLLMGAALVYSGEHYAVDVFFGWFTAAVVMLVVALAERWWPRRAVAGEVAGEVAGAGEGTAVVDVLPVAVDAAAAAAEGERAARPTTVGDPVGDPADGAGTGPAVDPAGGPERDARRAAEGTASSKARSADVADRPRSGNDRNDRNDRNGTAADGADIENDAPERGDAALPSARVSRR